MQNKLDLKVHNMHQFNIVVLTILLTLGPLKVNGGDIPVGEVVHDGPATPEQISIYLPITDKLQESAFTTVRYKKKSMNNWVDAHPLYHIRPNDTKGKSKPVEAFAGIITGLNTGAHYTIEVIVNTGKNKIVKTLNTQTRVLPEQITKVTKIIKKNATLEQIKEVFDNAIPGDVIQFENGTYNVNGLKIQRSGTRDKPIYIRGESRENVKINDSDKMILQFGASNIVLENLTLEGSFIDRRKKNASRGITLWDDIERVTIRNVTIKGVDMGILASGNTKQILVYDCSLSGNNRWEKQFIETKKTWSDDGIRIPGQGNVAFNNTLKGFGDALAVEMSVKNIGIHFYRNDILMTGDDAFESDYGVRNISFYDNRIHNAMTFVSVDPIYGGPLFVFRNIAINIGRGPYKLNSKNSGFFIYNNTVVRTKSFKGYSKWGWLQHRNGKLTAWGYRNNILIFKGGEKVLNMRAPGHNPIDFTHNAWYPDGNFSWPKQKSFNSLRNAQYLIKDTSPLFSDSSQRHANDIISTPEPFTEKIQLGENYLKEITSYYTPILSDKTKLRNAGVPINGVTDGFGGKSPDLGAIITGRPIPKWGDRMSIK